MNTKTIIILIAAIAVVSIGIVGAIHFTQPQSKTLENPLTIVDGIGNTVTISEYPERIISIAPSCTEILFAIQSKCQTICSKPEMASGF